MAASDLFPYTGVFGNTDAVLFAECHRDIARSAEHSISTYYRSNAYCMLMFQYAADLKSFHDKCRLEPCRSEAVFDVKIGYVPLVDYSDGRPGMNDLQ